MNSSTHRLHALSIALLPLVACVDAREDHCSADSLCRLGSSQMDISLEPGWNVTDPGLVSDVRDLWGADGQLLALGTSPELRWFDGATWGDWPGGYPTDPALPAAHTPGAIGGISLADFWLATSSGLAHWDGTAWSFTPYPNQIRALWASASDDIVGVGADNRIHHYDGAAWTSIAAPGNSQFRDVWGSGPTDVYAIGNQSVLHFNGAQWSAVNVGTSFANVWVASVWASAPDDVWIIGWWFTRILPGGGDAVLVHFNGARWQTVSRTSGAYPGYIGGRARSDVWLGQGANGLHFDGTTWAPTGTTGFASRLGDPAIGGIWVDAASVALTGGGEVAIWGGPGLVGR